MGKAVLGLWTTGVSVCGDPRIERVAGLPDPDCNLDNVYLDNVRNHAEQGGWTRGPASQWQAWWRAQVCDREPFATACRRGFVISTAELAALGVSRSAARTLIRRTDWSAPTRGTVAPLRVDDGENVHAVQRRRHALLAAATGLQRTEHVIACRSAAILHGLPTMRVPDHGELMAPNRNGLGRSTPGHSFGAALPVDEVTNWFGVAVTTVARTLVDLARHDRRDAIMAVDTALRERLVTAAALDAALAGACGWPGVRQARAVLALGDRRAESPLESIVRLALHDDGFPTPELQFEVAGYRVDFCWPAQRLILEADGRGKYSDDALWQEKTREIPLRRQGWRVERIIWRDVVATWNATSAGLWTAFTAS